MSEVANPSRTAPVALGVMGGGWAYLEPVTGIPVQLGTAALSKMLNSPRGVRLLTEGLTLPSGKSARNVAWFAQVSRMAGEDLGAAGALRPATSLVTVQGKDGKTYQGTQEQVDAFKRAGG